jgi:uncharacterized protein YecE (DUF72 family)
MTAQREHASQVHIGCSGWQYAHWRADFYPAELSHRLWFEHYAERFDTVEINNTFYRLPAASVFRSWRTRAPSGFVFAVKASRYLTHMKKLKDPAAPLDLFFSRARELGGTLGPTLYQLPPRWGVDPNRFETFLRGLPSRRQHAVEFRDPTWYRDDVLALMEKYRVTLCLHDMHTSASPLVDVGPFIYVRFHGTERYKGSYSDERLHRWAGWLKERVRSGKAIYAYFNNDVGGHAPRDAIRLRTMMTNSSTDTARSSEQGGHGS